MTYQPPSKEFMAIARTEEYTHPKTVDHYIARYKAQIAHGYDGFGMCQGLVDLLEELKRRREEAQGGGRP